MFCFVLPFGQWHKLLSRTREEKNRDSDGGGGTESKVENDKKEAVFEVEGIPLHYTREVRNMTTSTVSCNAYHVNICEEAVQFWRKALRNVDVVFHVSYERHGKVSARQLWCTSELDGILRLKGTERVQVPVTGKNKVEKIG